MNSSAWAALIIRLDLSVEYMEWSCCKEAQAIGVLGPLFLSKFYRIGSVDFKST